MSRNPVVGGNWKMEKAGREGEGDVGALPPRLAAIGEVDVAICAPFTALAAVVDSARGSPVGVYAQNMHQDSHGAFTGEVSSPMLQETGVQGVVLGHSERRTLFGESDAALALKVSAALGAGLTPLLGAGETESERERATTEATLRPQIADDLAGGP